MLHNPSEFGSNRCSVGAPVVLSDGLFGFRPLLATMILSTTFPPPSLLLCKVQYPPPLVIAGAMPPVSYTRPWFGFSLVEVGRILPNLLIPVCNIFFPFLDFNIFGSKLPPHKCLRSGQFRLRNKFFRSEDYPNSFLWLYSPVVCSVPYLPFHSSSITYFKCL